MPTMVNSTSAKVALIAAAFAAVVAADLSLAGPARAASPTGEAILRKVLWSEGRIPFEARQSVIVSGTDGAEATITHEISYGSGLLRVEYLMPKSAAGRLVVIDSRQRWEYDPANRTAIHGPRFRMPITQEAVDASLRRIETAYRLRADNRPVMLNGRRAYVLRIDPLQNDRPRRVWWIDAANSFVLRREVYDLRGQLDEISSYGNVNYHPLRNLALTRFTPPSGTQVILRKPQPQVTDFAALKTLGQAGIPLPNDLGRGFAFQSARHVDTHGMPGIQVVYSDGLTDVSVFVLRGTARVASTGVKGRAIMVGATPATIVESMPPFSVLSWQRAQLTLNLVADLSEETMLALAARLQ